MFIEIGNSVQEKWMPPAEAGQYIEVWWINRQTKEKQSLCVTMFTLATQ